MKDGPKVRDQISELSESSAKLGELIAAMELKIEEHSMKISELSDQISRLREESERAISEIMAHGGIQISRAAPLSEEDLAELLEREPSRRLICVSGSQRLGLVPGEAFDPRSKFASAAQVIQHARSGVDFAAAPI